MVGFICVFSHSVVMKRNNSFVTKDEILTFWSSLAIQAAYLCYHNYNKERFGFIFSCCIYTIDGEIYLRFLSWCNDEKK